jgi:two-component system chemotaxis sensor kinase CheA
MDTALLALERDGSHDAIDQLFRAVHSIKGMAATMSYRSVTELAHELENVLDKLRSGAVVVTTQVIDALFTSTDALETAIGLATAAKPRELGIGQLVERLRDLTREAEQPQTFTAEFQILATQRDPAAVVEHAPRHVRIDAGRLDNLMNLVGELAIARERLSSISDEIGDAALTDAALKTSQLSAALQSEIMSLRMLPVWQVFDRFARVVRDTAHSLGKRVDFTIEGKEIELDRSMLEEIGEPVLHLLRNALDHGIELPDEREAKGKAPVAKLTLTAERDRSAVLIRVTDDGRGIEPQRILARARELGFITADTMISSYDDLIRIIARPGFSTAETVTDISGRGVGIDVVATRVRSLGGTLEMRSVPGEGTSMTLRLPLTLAISRALLARVGGETYAIPLTHVVETFAVGAQMLREVKGKEMLVVRDEQIPAVRLRQCVGMERGDLEVVQAVLLELGEQKAGLIVDEFLGQQEIVVKQFDNAGGGRLFGGATILSDGAPALILDPAELV